LPSQGTQNNRRAEATSTAYVVDAKGIKREQGQKVAQKAAVSTSRSRNARTRIRIGVSVKDSERETSAVRNEQARAARATARRRSIRRKHVVRRLYYSLYVVANYIQAVSANYMIRRSLCDPRCVSGGAGRVPTTTGCARRVTRPTEAGGASRRGGTAAGTVALDVPERLDLDLRPW
jgi:hypothetical protein